MKNIAYTHLSGILLLLNSAVASEKLLEKDNARLKSKLQQVQNKVQDKVKKGYPDILQNNHVRDILHHQPGIKKSEPLEITPEYRVTLKCDEFVLRNLIWATDEERLNQEADFEEIKKNKKSGKLHPKVTAKFKEITDLYNGNTVAQAKNEDSDASGLLTKYVLLFDNKPITYPNPSSTYLNKEITAILTLSVTHAESYKLKQLSMITDQRQMEKSKEKDDTTIFKKSQKESVEKELVASPNISSSPIDKNTNKLKNLLKKKQEETQAQVNSCPPSLTADQLELMFKAHLSYTSQYHTHRTVVTEPVEIFEGCLGSIKSPIFTDLKEAVRAKTENKEEVSKRFVKNNNFDIDPLIRADYKDLAQPDYEGDTVTEARKTDPKAEGILATYRLMRRMNPVKIKGNNAEFILSLTYTVAHSSS